MTTTELFSTADLVGKLEEMVNHYFDDASFDPDAYIESIADRLPPKFDIVIERPCVQRPRWLGVPDLLTKSTEGLLVIHLPDRKPPLPLACRKVKTHREVVEGFLPPPDKGGCTCPPLTNCYDIRPK